MKPAQLVSLSVDELLDRFVKIALRQDEALLGGQIAKFNRLYNQMKAIREELKRRDGDQRRQLVRLFDYPNMQVRLKAATRSLAVAPAEARAQLEAIAASQWFPQSGEAGMCLWDLDRGVFKPS